MTYWQGYKIDHSKWHHRFGYWLLNLREAIRRSPRGFKLWLADQLSRSAMRLRGDKVSSFGYWGCIKGNHAAKLADEIRIDLICYSIDDLDGVTEKVQELASLAGATFETNWPK